MSPNSGAKADVARGPLRAMKRREQVQRNCQCASTSRQKTHQAKADRAPCAKISTMSDNRSSVVNLSRRIALAPRTRRQSRPHGAHRVGLGQVNSAGHDVAEYNLERKHTSSTSSAGLPKRRAVDTYFCDALWLGPSWPCISLHRYSIHFERGPPCQKKRSRRRNRNP